MRGLLTLSSSRVAMLRSLACRSAVSSEMTRSPSSCGSSIGKDSTSVALSTSRHRQFSSRIVSSSHSINESCSPSSSPAAPRRAQASCSTALAHPRPTADPCSLRSTRSSGAGSSSNTISSSDAIAGSLLSWSPTTSLTTLTPDPVVSAIIGLILGTNSAGSSATAVAGSPIATMASFFSSGCRERQVGG